jgi:ATP-binding cassette subfamily C protein CydD
LATAKAARWFIAGVAALALLNTALTISTAWCLTSFITQIFVEHQEPNRAISWLIGFALAGLAKAMLAWVQEWLGAFAAIKAKAQLRGKLLDSVIALGPDWVNRKGTANLQLLITQQLDSLDAYFAKFLPQLAFTLLVTPLLSIVIFTNDPMSGLSVLLTIPLIPVFMVLIGRATESVQKKQLAAMNRLNSQFAEALRGLTTLKVFGRAQYQVGVITATSQSYRARTMKVLRVSFLSGFALELISSLSVALVAVGIGLRLLDGQLTLQTGLFVLLLAPEAFIPLRMVGANFHTSADGVAASVAILDIIDEAKGGAGYPSAQLKFSFDRNQFTVLEGPSGAGKTTALNHLRRSIGVGQVAWLPQNIGLLEGTVKENIVGPHGNEDLAALDEAIKLAALDDLRLDHQVGQDAQQVSGGQAQRIGLARAFYAAITRNLQMILLDEPISAQDSARATIIDENLAKLTAKGFTVIAVSHQQLAHADKRVRLNNA